MTSRNLALALVFLFALAGQVFAPRAAAQTAVADSRPSEATPEAEARVLFQQGIELADQNRWAEAAERFRRALALRDSPVIAYNLGSALRELRRWVEARALFERVIADTSAAPDLQRSAAAALAELSPRLGQLTLHVQGLGPGDQVKLDDRPLTVEQLEVALQIDPGSHELRVERGDQTLHEETVLVFEGASRELTLRVPPDPREAARLALAPAAAAPLPSRVSVPARKSAAPEATATPWWVWAGAGTLAAGAITVAAILVANGNNSPDTASRAFDQPPVLHLSPKAP